MLEERIIRAARRLATGANTGNELQGAVLVSKDERDQLWLLAEDYDRIAQAEITPICPRCGADEIEELADAWFARHLSGFTMDGAAVLDRAGDTRVFDDRHFQCASCGYQTDCVDDFKPKSEQQPSS